MNSWFGNFGQWGWFGWLITLGWIATVFFSNFTLPVAA